MPSIIAYWKLRVNKDGRISDGTESLWLDKIENVNETISRGSRWPKDYIKYNIHHMHNTQLILTNFFNIFHHWNKMLKFRWAVQESKKPDTQIMTELFVMATKVSL